MKTIKQNTTLTAKSICDSECIFKVTVLIRKGNFATIKNFTGETKRTKVYTDSEGNEYLHPEKYSMSPIFRAIN
jgi:hypothetical protein